MTGRVLTAGRRAGPPGQPPRALLVPSTLALALLLLPLVALVARAPWRRMPDLLTQGAALDALLLSLQTATLATVVSLVLGIPLALLLARSAARGIPMLRALVTLPLVLPPVVGGVALLLLLGRRGLIGQYLASEFGITIPFTTTAVVFAEAFVAMPYLVLSLEGALRTAGQRYDVVAATLGAGRWTVLRRVTVPLLAPALVSGTVLCWARALGEFGATVTFAGSLPGVTRTMPIEVYLALESADPGAAVALSLVLVAVAVAVLLAVRRRWAVVPE